MSGTLRKMKAQLVTHQRDLEAVAKKLDVLRKNKNEASKKRKTSKKRKKSER
jgi:hypothetical protein